jgi:hypothetical protein
MPEMHAVAYAGGKSALKMSPAMLAACHTILHGRSMKAADEFMESLVTGLELSRGNPIYAARQWIIRKPHERRSYRYTVDCGNVILRAWNAWRAGESLDLAKRVQTTPTV